jgi:hypothetical protein
MATLTINTTGAQDARIAAAFGARLRLGGNANATQVKQQVIQFIVNVVQQYEQEEAAKAAVAGVTPIDPT